MDEEEFYDDRDDHFDDIDDIDDSEDDDESFDTVACPYCKKQIHEDTVRCPNCENYISTLDGPRLKAQPWWIMLGIVVCLIVVLIWSLW